VARGVYAGRWAQRERVGANGVRPNVDAAHNAISIGRGEQDLRIDYRVDDGALVFSGR
jgi:hypothetical protein